MDEKRSQILNSYAESPSDALTGQARILHNAIPHGTRQKVSSGQQQRNGLMMAQFIRTLQSGQANSLRLYHSAHRGMQRMHKNFQARSRRAQWGIIAIALTSLALLVSFGYTIFHNVYLLKYHPPVTVYEVGQPQTDAYTINASGLVSITNQYNVTFNAPGRVTVSQLLVQPGDLVKKDQPLLKLDPSQVQAQLNQAKGTVAADQSFFNSVSNATPYNALAVAKAQQDLQLAQNQYNALVGQINLHNSDLISQYSGTVLSIKVNPGDNINPNQTLLNIGDLSSVQLQAKLPISLRQQVQVNSQAQIVSPDGTGLTGQIASIVPVVDPQTDTFTVNVTTNNNAQQILWPNMIASIRLPVSIHAYTIPCISVLNPDQESNVYVIRDGHAYIRQVHVINRSPDGSSYYVDGGLSPHEQVIILPLNRLHEGIPVTVDKVEH
jgi:RND family efflux transporter MFP subunit